MYLSQLIYSLFYDMIIRGEQVLNFRDKYLERI